VDDPPRVGERGGHPASDTAAATGHQGDAGAHESAPAVAAPGTLWTSGYVTVASSRVRVTDQPGVNRHSAITQRSSSTPSPSTTYTSEYSPVEIVSVPFSRSTWRNCRVQVPVARCGGLLGPPLCTLIDGMKPWCMSRIRGPPSEAVASAIWRKIPTIVSGSVRPRGPKSSTPPEATKQDRKPSGSLASHARQYRYLSCSIASRARTSSSYCIRPR